MLTKTVKVRNNTHYYEIDRTRKYNRVPNTYSFSFKSLRCQEFYIRSYYEYQDIQNKGGFTVFLTLTYNSKHLPKFLGLPCFDSSHIVKLIHALRNRMHRNYGADFSYIITKEYGSKRSRPHYHALFFVDRNKNFRLSSRIFVDHVKELWQGPLSLHHGNYKLMAHGLCHAGQNFGQVFSHAALEYTCKYAVKDLTAYKFEMRAFNEIAKKISESYTEKEYINLVEEWLNYIPDGTDNPIWLDIVQKCGFFIKNPQLYSIDELRVVFQAALRHNKFLLWLSRKEEIKTNSLYKEFKNHFSCKPQHSNKLGLSVLDSSCLNKENGTVMIWSGNKVKMVPIPLYIYRKLFYEPPFVDENTGNVKYVLSLDGIKHKLSQLNKYKLNAFNYYTEAFEYVQKNISTYKKLHPAYELKTFTRAEFDRLINYILVYDGRHYNPLKCESLDLQRDYAYSLDDSYFRKKYKALPFCNSKEIITDGYISYEFHPEFIGVVNDLNIYNDVLNFYFSYKDKDMQDKHELYKRVKEAHNCLTFKT